MARPANKTSTDVEQTPGIDAILDGLEGVVRELESGNLSLEKALERFEQGVRLARRGGELLDAVEQRVEILLADRDATEPLHSGSSDPDPNEDTE